jgi:hypothetical protein
MRDLNLLLAALAAVSLLACQAPPTESDDDDDVVVEPVDDLAVFEDDCDEEQNEGVDAAMRLEASNHQTYEGVSLCDGDVDYYAVDVPEGRWLSVEVIIEEDGADLDLIEVNEDGEPGWGSVTAAQPYERLAWFNPGPGEQRHYLMVDGAGSDSSDYTILIRRSVFHEGLDCDDFYPDEDAGDVTGPCNKIMQFPGDNGLSDGYVVSHEPHYSNLRREVIYLVREAALRTYEAFPDTNPIGLLDMSQRDGDVPGRMRGQLRHPEGTHVGGNDLDIAYFQTGDDNMGRPVCANDNYFCTGDPILLDAERTAYFMVQLFDSPMTRVIGVDTRIAPELEAALPGLEDQGLITAKQRSDFDWKLAYGDGWPFHHHHMHFSWSWEEGYERDAAPEGCMVEPDLY